MTEKQTLSPNTRSRLQCQGYHGFSDAELSVHKFGIRFAYYLCGSLVLLGLVLKSEQILLAMTLIAILGMVPPRHPLDYIFNFGVRHIFGKPKTPPRAAQARFACSIATAFLLGINYSFYIGNDTAAYIIGAGLLTSAFLVSVFDICIPSMIWVKVFGQK